MASGWSEHVLAGEQSVEEGSVELCASGDGSDADDAAADSIGLAGLFDEAQAAQDLVVREHDGLPCFEIE